MKRFGLPRRRDAAGEYEHVAASAARLAALSSAGASPHAAWRYVAATAIDAEEQVVAAQVVEALRTATPIGASMPGVSDAWWRVAVTCSYATEVGAPLAACLTRTSAGLAEAARLQRHITASIAGAEASTRVVLALPPVAALAGWLLGFDVPHVLFGTALGWTAILIAGVLLASAARWSRALVRAARVVPQVPGLAIELVSIGVAAGLPPAQAADLAHTLVPTRDEDAASVDTLVDFAAEAGLPVAALLAAEADRVRLAVATDGLRAANSLSVRLLVPLGLLVLPAFLLLGAMPIGVAALSSTGIAR